MTGLNNVIAREGCDRCVCGCKYWENDRCIDCGTLITEALYGNNAPTGWTRTGDPEAAPVWCGADLQPLTGTYTTADGWTIRVRSDPVRNGRLALSAHHGTREARNLKAIHLSNLTDLSDFNPTTHWRNR